MASSSGVYQTVGTANYYLADGSTNRNTGMTNINSTLLKDLRSHTTYPPLVCSNVAISADTTLAPQAQREAGVPDLGYAYDPLDYAFTGVRVTNATLRLAAGTAIASFGASYGIGLLSGSQLISMGAPTSLNRIVRFNLVQECSNTNWNGGSISVKGDWLGGPTAAQASFLFTDWSMPAQDGYHFSTSGYTMTNAFSHCQFHGGKLSFGNPAFTLTNSLIERANTSISDSVAMSPTIRNCLFYGGQLSVSKEFGGTWTFRDNLFDGVAIVQPGKSVDAAYNGFTTNTVNALGGSSNTTNLVANYQTGPLGFYYYPTNGGSYSLANLINAGSTWATNLGLYHFTTTTNQVKEAGTKVDIGFHLVALGTNGLPVSTSGDGLGDYLKDSNGNGVYDSADMGNWKTNDTCGDGLNDYIKYLQGRNLRVRATNDPNNLIQLNVYTPLK